MRPLSTAVVASVVAAAALVGCAADDHPLTGTVKVVHDVAGFRDTPVTEGLVAAVPAHAVDDVFASVPPDQMTDTHLGYLAAELPASRVTDAGGTVAEIRRGRFGLDVSEGGYLVCVVGVAGSGPDRTRGCDRVHLPASGILAVTFGEAPVHVEIEQ